MRKTNKSLVLAALMAAVLAGCGGGGGDDKGAGNTGNPGTPTTPENTTGPDLQNTVPAPTYAAGSQELDAWNVLQQARQACGFGMLQQDTRLDAAAKAHANYLALNNTGGHDEIQGKPGFTGANHMDRISVQGFKGQASEGIAYGGTGMGSMVGLLSAPYHAMDAISSWRSVGVSYGGNSFVINYGSENNSHQRLGAGVVANYPCEGAKHVSTGWGAESPNPFPDLTGSKGTPILLRADGGSLLEIVNIAITRVSTGESLSYRTITQKNDSNKQLSSNEFIAVPLDRLSMNETYSVTYQGTVDGKPVGKTFTFKPTVMSGFVCRNPATGEIYQCEPN